MEVKNIKCENCGKIKTHPICCDRPMDFANTSWVCKKCKKKKNIKCCDSEMVPETDEDIDLPEEAVEEFESMFDNMDHRENKDKPDYVG